METPGQDERNDTTIRVMKVTRDRFASWLDDNFLRSADVGINMLLDFADKNNLTVTLQRSTPSRVGNKSKEEIVDGVHSN